MLELTKKERKKLHRQVRFYTRRGRLFVTIFMIGASLSLFAVVIIGLVARYQTHPETAIADMWIPSTVGLLAGVLMIPLAVHVHSESKLMLRVIDHALGEDKGERDT